MVISIEIRSKFNTELAYGLPEHDLRGATVGAAVGLAAEKSSKLMQIDANKVQKQGQIDAAVSIRSVRSIRNGGRETMTTGNGRVNWWCGGVD